ncbi:hypothetical protein RUM43_002006 [Polyplax serrata]|uniref:Uncharacterized protein n=1 Tax=Polyplax serrata TaxID=468196 RepID=A0AAN8S5P2_POLSC
MLTLIGLDLYDRISSKVVSPMRSPPSDAVERCRDAIFFLRELEHSAVEPEIDYVDLDDLRELLLKPHFRNGMSKMSETVGGGLGVTVFDFYDRILIELKQKLSLNINIGRIKLTEVDLLTQLRW